MISSPRGFRFWSLACLLALSPSLAFAQQARPAGVVTTLKGEATVARTTLPRPAALNFRDDVFFRDRIMTERDSLVRVLLGGKALLTIRELSDFTIQEEANKATITMGFGRMALQVMRSLMRPGEEIEVRTPNAVAAIRGSFHFFDVSANQTVIFNSSPTPMTSGGTTYTGGPGELFTFQPGVPPTQKLLGPNDILGYSQQFLGNIPKLGGDKASGASANLINNTQTGQAAALASTLSGQGGDPFSGQTGGGGAGFTPPPPNTYVYVNQPGGFLGNCAQNPGGAGCQGLAPPPPPPPPPPAQIPQVPTIGPIITLPGQNIWCDDCTTNLSFGFSFPFQGHVYTGGELSSNGFLSLGGSNGQGCCSPSLFNFLNGAPRIALAWYDLFPVFTGPAGTVSYNTFPGFAAVTFNSVPEFSSSPPGNTMQMLLLSDGRIVLSYPDVQAPTHHTSLIGVTPGGGVSDPGSVNFASFTTPTDTGTLGTVYQLFNSNSFISSGKVIVFTPNGQGGWIVLDPPATDFAFYTLGSGNVATLQSPLLNNPATPQIVIGDVAWIQGQLVVAGSVGPLVSLTGGPHSLAILPGSSIFDLAGSATATVVVEGNTLTLGTDRPIRGDIGGAPAPLAVPLLQASGASVGTEQVVRLDTALLEASAPLINLMAGSNLVSNRDVLELTRNARLTANLPGDALFNVNGSVLSIYNGSLANVAGGSALRVTGSLVSLTNGSTLNILNGWLVNVSGGSVFSLMGGSLATFGAGTNTLNLTNNAALCAGCSITTSIPNLGGIPVLLANGATAANVTAGPGFVPFAGLSATNRVNVTGASGAVLAVNGAASRVVLRP